MAYDTMIKQIEGFSMTFLAMIPFLNAASFTGTYLLVDSKESLLEQKEAALAKTLDALNPLMRFPAARRLSNEPPQCEQYQITPTPKGQSVQCDIHLPLLLEPGVVKKHTTKKGQTIKVESQIEDSAIHFKLHGESGIMSTHMILSQSTLTVTKSVESPYLPVPLVMTYTYRKATQ